MSTIEERVAALESALASMTAAEKRIVELPAASSVANDDFVALDGVANGSRRFAASNLGGKAEVMTEAEWDDLPDSKLTDGKVYALSGVSPSTQDNPLWQKLGFASLDTAADDCSDAINELNTGLTNINSNLMNFVKYTTITGTTTTTGALNIPNELLNKPIIDAYCADQTTPMLIFRRARNYFTCYDAALTTPTPIKSTSVSVVIWYFDTNIV